MFLSRIRLNLRRRGARWLVSSPQRLHAAVLGSFADPVASEEGEGPRVLWRLDHCEHVSTLYVVSPEMPDFAHLAEQAGWPTTERGEVRDYAPLLSRIEIGQHWAFRLTGNPTHYAKDLNGGRARRLGHVTVRQQEEWFLDKAGRAGFDVLLAEGDKSSPATGAPLELIVSNRMTHEFRKRGTSAPVTLTTARFDGVLCVRDASALRSALIEGIGPAKAYGCGLLTLAPLTPRQ